MSDATLTVTERPRSAAARSLDLGCGARKKSGYVGVDRCVTAQTDVVADVGRLPFAASSFERVWLNHVAEHVESIVALMEEIWRVSAPGGLVEIRGPHFSSPSVVWGDPTHRRPLSYISFFCFTPRAAWYFTPARFEIVSCRLRRHMGDVPPRPVHWWNRVGRVFDHVVEGVSNRSELWVHRAERHWCRFVAFDEIQVVLRCVKGEE
jgi:SAM-dependent methyltransferase